jgi:hypothetical protein
MKQHEANRIALEMAAAMVRDADFDSLFGDEYEPNKDDDVCHKAQAYAVRRIEGLLK